MKSPDASARPRSNSERRKVSSFASFMSSGIHNLFTVSFIKFSCLLISARYHDRWKEKEQEEVTKEEFRWKRARKRGHRRTVERKVFWISFVWQTARARSFFPVKFAEIMQILWIKQQKIVTWIILGHSQRAMQMRFAGESLKNVSSRRLDSSIRLS